MPLGAWWDSTVEQEALFRWVLEKACCRHRLGTPLSTEMAYRFAAKAVVSLCQESCWQDKLWHHGRRKLKADCACKELDRRAGEVLRIRRSRWCANGYELDVIRSQRDTYIPWWR